MQIAPHLRRESSGDVVFLFGEREHYALRGAAVEVLGLIDGKRCMAELIDACPPSLRPELMLFALDELADRGFVVEARPAPREHLAFLAGMSIAHAEPVVELVDASADSVATRAMASALEAAGIAVSQSHVHPSSAVAIVVDDYLASSCASAARAARRAGRACFLVKPGGLRPMIGPYLSGEPGEPCADCLLYALREQRPVERMLQRLHPEGAWYHAPAAVLPASVAAAANMAAVLLRRALDPRNSQALTARLWTLDFPRFELVEHRVRRRPQCAACGDPALQAQIGERPVELASVAIGYAMDGGFRRESPAASYGRLRHLVSPVLGPVTYLGPMAGRHHEGRPVFGSGYFVVPQHAPTTNAFDHNCAGKGSSVEQARMSALAEAVERYSGVYRGDEAVVHSSRSELGVDAVDLAEVQLFSDAQRVRGDAPPPLADHTSIGWTPAWSLAEQRRRWLPLAYCYSAVPSEYGAEYCRHSSNGSAAGNCLEEAIFQGLLELIERDAAAIWWYSRARRPAARVPAAAATALADAERAYAVLGWSLWTLDLTHDLGVPVVVAVARHLVSDRFAMGFGCHPDPILAVRRAVSELHQVFDPDGTHPSPWDGMATSRLDCLIPDPDMPVIAPAPAVTSHDLKYHIEALVARLRARGLDTIVVDKTRPELGLHVAQVVVPGLRHVWPRFAPGRIYTVAPAIGWLGRPVGEVELNPHSLLI